MYSWDRSEAKPGAARSAGGRGAMKEIIGMDDRTFIVVVLARLLFALVPNARLATPP